MSFRLVIAVSALLVAAAAQAQQAPAGQAEAPASPAPAAAQPAATEAHASKPGDATAGAAKAGVCAACHGIDGNPASSQYPKLAGQQESYIVRQLGLFKTTKRLNPIMIGFVAPLSEQDMHDIGAYFASKTSLPGVAEPSSSPVANSCTAAAMRAPARRRAWPATVPTAAAIRAPVTRSSAASTPST